MNEQCDQNASMEMPKYICHKQVHALKIAKIKHDHVAAIAENRETDGSATIKPEDDGYAPFKVDRDYVLKT